MSHNDNWVRLSTIIDEEFGTQPVMSAEEMLSFLERKFDERRRKADDLTPLEQAIWAAAYARTVYPVRDADGTSGWFATADEVVESAERYADTIVRQYRESQARRAAR